MKNKYFTILIAVCIMLFSCKERANNSTPEKQVDTVSKAKALDSINQLKTEKVVEGGKNSDTIHHYICFKDDKVSSRMIWVSYTETNKALQVKYKGQKEAINLVFDKEEVISGGAKPTIIKYYNEIYKGQQNGTYKLTHSGIWDYVEYVRKKDGKTFNFTIDHESNPYGKEACF